MAIDIFSIQPHEVSRDLRGYSILFFGSPKTGKTTIASKFPKTLLLAFETGYLAIPGIMAQPINKWSEFKQVLKQLKQDMEAANKEGRDPVFFNVVIDTVDIAFDLCEKFICNQNDVQSVGDLAYGKGYNLCKKEFDEALRSIQQMGYGLIMISHSQDKTFKDEDGVEFNQIVPTLSNQGRLVVERMSDIIGYANGTQDPETGETHTMLYMRQTPRFMAGSRFRYTPDAIEFTYDNLVNAIGDAIDAEANNGNAKYVTDNRTSAHEVQKSEIDFDATMADIRKLIAQLQEATGAEFKTNWVGKIKTITDKYLGNGNKINDATEKQSEQLVLILDDLKELVANGI